MMGQFNNLESFKEQQSHIDNEGYNKEFEKSFDDMFADDFETGEIKESANNSYEKISDSDYDKVYNDLLGDDVDLSQKSSNDLSNLNSDGLIDNMFSDDFSDSNDLSDSNEHSKSEDSEKENTDKSDQKNTDYKPNSYVTIDGERYRTDDNGKPYQKRNPETGTYEGLPNTTYELNGYRYETDSKGRITKVDGTLRKKTHEGKLTINDNVNGMKDNDEKGHLIGDQFDGSNLNGNLVAMDFDVNRSDYKRLEKELAKAVSENKNVKVSIEVQYDGNSDRPSKIIVKYEIDGEKFKEVFNN